MTDTQNETGEVTGPLDLGDADVRGFAPIDPNRYKGEIVEISWDAVKNPGGKTPVGTPMLKVQFRVENPEIDGEVIDQDRRVFTQFVNPPRDYDKRKRETMLGMIARFFMALGFTEEQVKAAGFNPDFEELKGIPVVLTVSKEQKKDRNGKLVPDEYNNPVKKVAHISTWAEADSSGLM